ncbi:MAG: hypothetical protein JNN00_08155 [Chitinophagaceae bacterium]|nr:hypothetical protein [Chitinophagaceae bacterium]
MIKQTVHIAITFFLLAPPVMAQNTYNEISLPALMKKKQEGDSNMVIVDVRTNGEFYDSASRGMQSNIGRLKGSLHIELRNLQQDPEAIRQLAAYKDKDIYLICSHSYRSRSASNILLKNGFTHVNNVQGGMTEWFRRYDELFPYKNSFYETSGAYKNISASQVTADLLAGKKLLLIGISNTPRFFYDTATITFYEYFPLFKDAIYFNAGDSLKVLDEVRRANGQPVVLFNMVNNGAAEMADWLVKKGVKEVSYLVGNNYYFYEYIRNKGLVARTKRFMVEKNVIEFITAPNYCSKVNDNGTLLIDLRHDTLFARTTSGIKYDYKNAKGSVNFFADRGAGSFMQAFPDKNKEYVLMSLNGIAGLELADVLARDGYRISWLMGGLQRLEWYTINMENFGCKDILIK